MAKTEHYHTRFEADRTYHVYNRSVDQKPLFTQDRNYDFFLGRIEKYLPPVLDVYAWCLMNNHFHLMVRVKDLPTFQKLANQAEPDIHKITAHAFQKMFQSYAMAFNKQETRVGTLFQEPFKRSLIDSDSYFTQLIYYIHSNPQLHGFIDDFRDYKWSSYNRILLREEDMTDFEKLANLKVLEWFGGREAYLKYHSSLQKNTEPKITFDDD